MAKDTPRLTEKELRQWKLIGDFRERLEVLLQQQRSDPSWAHKQRHLQQADYLCLFLFALVNPAIKTLRAVAAASQLERVQAEVCTRSVSLSSLSEAQHLVDPVLLENLVESLSQEIQGPRPKDPQQAWQVWLARDSSIFRALPRMIWAEYGGGKAGHLNNGVRWHLSFHLWDDKPVRVAVTPGKVCERKIWREQLEAGATYVGDRYFAEDYKMFGLLEEKQCRFVLRLRDEAVVQSQAENPLPTDAAASNLLSDIWATLGCQPRYRTGRWRVITVRKTSGHTMRLVTNIPPEQMSAAEILALYGRRWQIECFFRWIKCLLGCRHWLAESRNGVTIELYLALIAGLLLQVVLGKRPGKRLWERLQLYLLGWATVEELLQAVNHAVAKASAKKS